MSFEQVNNQPSLEQIKAKVLEIKKELEDQGMKVEINEEKIDNIEALRDMMHAFSEIRNAHRVTVSDKDGNIIADISKPEENKESTID